MRRAGEATMCHDLSSCDTRHDRSSSHSLQPDLISHLPKLVSDGGQAHRKGEARGRVDDWDDEATLLEPRGFGHHEVGREHGAREGHQSELNLGGLGLEDVGHRVVLGVRVGSAQCARSTVLL